MHSGSGVAAAPVALEHVQPRITQLQHGIRKPKKYTDGTVRYENFCSTREPKILHEALDDPRWKKAMQQEYNALIKNKTWHLVKESRGKNIIDCKWVFKIKKKADGL